MSITLTTVGYGDVVPATTLGRMIVLVTLVFVFLQVPRETNRLVALLSKQSVYVRQKYVQSAAVPHVIVCGAISGLGSTGLRAFLEELFADDHGDDERHAVVLARGSPSPELQVLLHSPKFRNGVTYLDGNVMSHADLLRACAPQSAGIFLMCNKWAPSPDAEDSSTILRALAVKRFVYQVNRRDVFVCAQLIRAENRVLFHSAMSSISSLARAFGDTEQLPALTAGRIPTMESEATSRAQSRQPFSGSDMRMGSMPSLDMHAIRTHSQDGTLQELGSLGSHLGADQDGRAVLEGMNERASMSLSISVQEMKLNLLAKSCLCPGIIPMLFNLVASDDGSFESSRGEDGADG